MAFIEYTLKALLKTLAAGGCHAVINKSSPIVRPYITFQTITSVPENTLNGTTGFKTKHFQIDLFADTYDAVKGLEDTVEAAMKSASFENIQIMTQDLYEEESGYFRVIMEYHIWP